MNQVISKVYIKILPTSDRGDVIALTRSFSVVFKGQRIVVPKGFESDGASVPRLFWRTVFPPTDAHAIRAAILHDYIYRKADHCGITRKEADTAFFALMIWDGVPTYRAYRAYLGVRLFGGGSWRGV